MAVFLNTILNEVLVSLATDYNVYEVFDVDDANVVLNDASSSNFPIAFYAIKNNGTINNTRHKKAYPNYTVAVWLVNLYEEDNKTELDANYKGLRLDAIEFVQRLQRTEAFARVPENLLINPSLSEFDADLDILASVVQIDFSMSIDIQEDTSRVCAPLNVSSFILNDNDLDAISLDASASSFRGVAYGATGGTHAWSFTLDSTTVSISGLGNDSLSADDIASLATIGMINASGTYNAFTFEKNPDTLPSLNFVISVSHTYDYRSKGAVSDATTATISKREILSFESSWSSSGGDFRMDVLTSDASVVTWVLPDGTEITDNSLSTSLGGFDGTTQTVLIKADDFSKITEFETRNTGSDLENELDLSLLTNLNGNLDLGGNNLTGLVLDTTTPKTIDNLYLDANDFPDDYDINFLEAQVTHNGFIQAFNMGLNRLTLGHGTCSALTIRKASATPSSIKELDASNCEFTGGVTIHQSLSYTHRIDFLSFKATGNDISTLDCINTSLVNLDFSNANASVINCFSNAFATSLSLGGTSKSLISLNANALILLTSFNIGSVTIDNTTTSILFSNGGIDATLIDSIYNQIASNYDGVSSLSGLNINTVGNDAPTASSSASRTILSDAGATILF